MNVTAWELFLSLYYIVGRKHNLMVYATYVIRLSKAYFMLIAAFIGKVPFRDGAYLTDRRYVYYIWLQTNTPLANFLCDTKLDIHKF